MAAEYAKNNEEGLDGLIMFASYPANYEDFIDFPIPILTIIGSRDPGAPKQERFYEAISDSARIFVIEGGNHLQYTDYSFKEVTALQRFLRRNSKTKSSLPQSNS